jgi:hypothetical protein
MIIAEQQLKANPPLFGTLVPTQQLCVASNAAISSLTSESKLQLKDEVKEMMKILLGYDGSESSDAALRCKI